MKYPTRAATNLINIPKMTTCMIMRSPCSRIYVDGNKEIIGTCWNYCKLDTYIFSSNLWFSWLTVMYRQNEMNKSHYHNLVVPVLRFINSDIWQIRPNLKQEPNEISGSNIVYLEKCQTFWQQRTLARYSRVLLFWGTLVGPWSFYLVWAEFR